MRPPFMQGTTSTERPLQQSTCRTQPLTWQPAWAGLHMHRKSGQHWRTSLVALISLRITTKFRMALMRSDGGVADEGEAPVPRRGASCRATHIVVLTAALALVGCTDYKLISQASSPDGHYTASLEGLNGRVNYRRVVVRDNLGRARSATVFEAGRSSAAIAWVGDADLVVRYEDGTADILKLKTLWATNRIDGRWRILTVHLRPVVDPESTSVILE